jgi:hypothetical protein
MKPCTMSTSYPQEANNKKYYITLLTYAWNSTYIQRGYFIFFYKTKVVTRRIEKERMFLYFEGIAFI